MFRINLKSSIATVAVIAGVLAVAGPASEVAVQGAMAKTPSPAAEGHLYAGVARTSAGFKSLSGMDSETEFMDYTDDSLLD